MEQNSYTLDELKTASLEYFNGDTLASNVWINKYALKMNGKYGELSPKDMIERMAKEIHRMESTFPNPLSYKQIFDTLDNFKHFVFGGSILFGLGNDHQVSSLGNCFFIDNNEDSYGAIFNLDENMAQLMKRRGGVGVTIENLRPNGSKVNNSAQSSTGATSFMDRYSNTTREVAQDGRRGALMISCHINHPDIKDFIIKKDDRTKVTGANISVKITDDFMKAVDGDEDYILRWPIIEKQPVIQEQLVYNKLYKRDDGSYIMKVKAREVWNLIIKQAHKNAEPGVLFWDQIIRESPADCYADEGMITKGTNPCGEVPLSPFDSCRLGSINLNNMVLNPYTKEAVIDWNTLERVSKYAQRFMDDIVSLEEEKILAIIAKIVNDPEPMELKQVEFNLWTKVLEVLRKGRRTGVGMFGLGDMLAKLGLKYDCDQASELKARVAQTIAINCYKETVNLAEERGCFPIWNADKESRNPFIIRVISDNFSNKEYKKYLKFGRRNIALLSIAPTGTMALQAQTTSGIEPVFKCFYYRKRKVNPSDKDQTKPITKDENGDWWEQYAVFHPEFEKWAKLNNIEIDDLSERQLEKLVAESPWAGSESHTVNPIEKVKSQGIIQKWVDHSISITHNLPENVTLEEVNKIYFEAWKSGCKGCTIYREGSRAGVLTTKKDEDDFTEVDAPKRPKEIPADYYVATANGIKFAVIVGLYKGKPYEIFAFENPPMDKNTKGRTVKIKKGHYKFINGEFEIDNVQLSEARIQQRTLTLTASMLLRGRAPIQHVIKVIKKIDDNITSFSSVVTRILGKYIVETLEEKCPECGGNLVREEGCVHCQSCSYSKC